MTKKVNDNGNTWWEDAHGAFHRVDGPAFIWWSSEKEWWFDGTRYCTTWMSTREFVVGMLKWLERVEELEKLEKGVDKVDKDATIEE